MKRLSFLLLDANIVIELFEQSLWDRFLTEGDVHLARTVVDEARFYYEGSTKKPVDLAPYEQSKQITVFDVPASDLAAFIARFDPAYAENSTLE
jgi:hypothetical protein